MNLQLVLILRPEDHCGTLCSRVRQRDKLLYLHLTAWKSARRFAIDSVIMVKGELVCIGASQELKQRFGAGYDIHVKLNPGRSDEDEDVGNIKTVIENALTCEIRDENLVISLTT